MLQSPWRGHLSALTEQHAKRGFRYSAAESDVRGGGGASTCAQPAHSVVPSPNRGVSENNALDAVSCPSASACMVVGNYGPAASTLAEVWSGQSWKAIASPNGGTGQDGGLEGVSCLSAKACAAVGGYLANGSGLTLIELWNGTRWTIPMSPSPGDDSNLDAVSCAPVCTAVGYFQSTDWYTLVERN